MLAVAILCAQSGRAADQELFRQHLAEDYNAASIRLQNHPADDQAAEEVGRLCFDYAEFATNSTQRATLAIQGIAAMRDLIARKPGLAAGHYYLAMSLGQLARTKMLGALSIVKEMEREFKVAQDDDERWDYAGPARNLGELYYQAPGWPTSIGSRHKARYWLERAVAIAPEYPENHLNLLEAYLEWGDTSGVQRELQALEDVWPAARLGYPGRRWESDLADWKQRRIRLIEQATQWLSNKPGRTAP
jgi:tetratricopeptide (TPR) repeat protein